MEVSDDKKRANRANAQKSTGPRSPDGKAVSARNRLSHGMRAERFLLRDEKVRDWNAHRAGIRACLAPQNYLEEEIADNIAFALWRLRRATRSELGLTVQREWRALEMQKVGALELGAELVRLPVDGDLLMRYERSAQGTIMHGLGMLREFRALGSFGKIAASEEGATEGPTVGGGETRTQTM